MLLQNPMRVEGRCPWRWSLAMAGGLLAVAVLVSGIGLRAETANKADQAAQAGGDEPAKDPAKKDEPAKKDKPAKKAPDPAIGDDDDLKKALDELPAEVRDHLKKVFEGMDRELPDERLPGAGEMKKEMQKTIIRMLKQGGGPGGFGGFGGFGGGGFGGGQAGFGGGGFGGRFGGGVFGRADTVVHGRLGVFLDKPSDTLVEQLDLPKGQGLVINRVQADSAAAKAGMKASDILLELNGKPVPNDVHKFITMLNDVKANTPVDAVVLRKGKRETIKGLSLPEAKAAKAQEGFPEGGIGFGGFQPGGAGGFARFPGQQGGIGFAGFGGGPGQVMTTMIRTDDRFTTRYQEGSLIITLTGTVADGKAKLGAIHVNDGNDSKKYESVDKVPEQYRDKVKHLVEMSEKGSVRVEIKTNPDKKPDDGEKKP